MKSASEIGAAILERLAAQAAANRASGERLYSAVRAIYLQHLDLTAKRVIRLLAPGIPERIDPAHPRTHEASTRGVVLLPITANGRAASAVIP